MGLALAAALTAVSAEVSEADVLSVSARCERAAGPGRVRCEVELTTTSPRTLRWADVQVLATPPFVTPLKGRASPDDAAVREPARIRFAMALVAKERGEGEARVRVRAVVCDPRGCAPLSRTVPVAVSVGAPPPGWTPKLP